MFYLIKKIGCIKFLAYFCVKSLVMDIFDNPKNRVDFLSVCETKAINGYGELFSIGDLVVHEDTTADTAIIESFSLDKKTMDVIAHTNKGYARIQFIHKMLCGDTN